MMKTQMIVLTLMLAVCASCVYAALSTNVDGSFQAIAQGPNCIELYWRHNDRPAELFVDGRSLGEFPPNPKHSFASKKLNDLKPNTTYAFKCSAAEGSITEQTWADLPEKAAYDVLVIGGTASGVAAAITAARAGLNVALVETTNRLGGMSSNGLGAADTANPLYVNGMFREFGERIWQYYDLPPGRVKFEPRVANAIIKSMVYEQPAITIFMKADAVSPIMAGNRITGAEIWDQSGKRGLLYAAVIVDATDTADIAAAAGAPWRAGREARSEAEPHAGVIYYDDRAQEILPGSTGEADSKMQSYSYLMIWKDYGDKEATLISKPNGYSADTFAPSPEWKQTWNVTSGALQNKKYEINTHPFGGDWPGINHDYPTATHQRRKEIDDLNRDRGLGYLYFMQNERGHKNLGLADDEFLDNDNFPHGLYVREARRVMGEHILAENEVTFARDIHRVNSIGIAGYPMDSHAMEDLKDPTRKDKGEGEMFLSKVTTWSQIPYGVIVPQKIEGLLVTTAVSATHVAYGTLRMEPVRMSCGQAAGFAAYYAITRNIRLRDVNASWIQDKILSQNAYISWNSDITPKVRHFKAINFMGARGVLQQEPYNPDEALTYKQAAGALNTLIALEGETAVVDSIPPGQADAAISRGEFASWLVEAKTKTDPAWQVTVSGQSYDDVPKDSAYYKAVEILRAHRITSALFSNYEPGKFQPYEPINRGDAAQAMYLAHRASAMK
ncbi:MAG: FAD-dependent oxidoreductase [Armatimonadetes bacterium]|nr:FAD-dependent oxidoreductase [Armatimonadota bacterium]